MQKETLRAGACADSHLGYKQYSLARREKDLEQAFMDFIFQAYQEGLKLLLHAGDLLNVKNPNSRTLKFLKGANRFLIEKGMTLIEIDGNHDFCKPSWMDIVRDEMFDTPFGIHSICNKRIEYEGWTITGVPFFHDFPEDLKTPGDILLLHTPVLEFVKYPSDKTPTIADLPTDLYPLIIVGDTHVPQLETAKNSLVLSPGSTEMTSSSECDQKYWWKIEYQPDGEIPEVTPVSLKTRSVIRLNITTEEELDEAVALLKERATDEPMVLGSYLKSIPDAIERLKAAVDLEKVILRPKPIGSTRVEAEFDENADSILPLSAYVEDFITKDDPLYGVALALTQTDEGNELITTFIEERTEVLKNS